MRVRISIEITGNYIMEVGKEFEVSEYFEMVPASAKEETNRRKEKLRLEIADRVEQLLEVGGL